MPIKENRMTNDRYESILGEIPNCLALDTEYPLNDTLVYAQAGRNWVEASIFKDLGDRIVWRDPGLDEIFETVKELWNAQTEKPRWRFIEYFVKDGRFTVTYTYPDELPPEDEIPLFRREEIIRRYFGDKPIIYPQPDDEPDGYPIYDL